MEEKIHWLPLTIGMIILASLFFVFVFGIYPGADSILNFIELRKSVFQSGVLGVALDIFSGLLIGAVSGIWVSVVVSRRSRFDTLISEALSCVNNIDYMVEDSTLYVDEGNIHNLLSISSDLMHFGHKVAGIRVGNAFVTVQRCLIPAAQGRIDLDQFVEELNKARRLIRQSSPSAQMYFVKNISRV